MITGRYYNIERGRFENTKPMRTTHDKDKKENKMQYYLTDHEFRNLETELANIKNALRELEFLDGEARFRNLSSEERQEYINRKKPCIICDGDIVTHSNSNSYEVVCSECGFIYAED